MDICETKRQLDCVLYLKKTLKKKKKSNLKKIMKLMPNKKALRKKGKSYITRSRKIDDIRKDYNFTSFLYDQCKDQYGLLEDNLINEVIAAAEIPEQDFDCITIKTSRRHNKIRLYCEKFGDDPIGYVCDCYVVNLDTGYVYAYRQEKEEDFFYLLSYFIITPSNFENNETECST